MEGGSAPREETQPAVGTSVNKFEEYRFFSESTARLTDRRQMATQVWVTLHTLLFAALGYLMKEAGANVQSAMESGAAAASGGRWLFVASAFGPLLLLGLWSCVIWRKMLLSYQELISWRYDQLMEMERAPQLEGSHRFFNREWEDFFGPDAKRRRISFTRLEVRLPTVLIFVYLAFGVVASLIGLGLIST